MLLGYAQNVLSAGMLFKLKLLHAGGSNTDVAGLIGQYVNLGLRNEEMRISINRNEKLAC